MDLGLKDKVAVIGASSKGLGYAVAHRLAREGAKVALCARGEKELIAAAEQIQQESGTVVFAQPCDVTKPEAITAFVNVVRASLGPIDIMVTNAGGPPPGTFETLPVSAWQEAFELNMMSSVHMIREALPDMKAKQKGSILFMVSVSAIQPLPNLILSNAIRAGVIGLAKTLADEFAPFGIRVNSLCPGYYLTGRMEQVIRSQAEKTGVSYEKRLEQVQAQVPMGRLGRPEEFGDVAAFLVSERASYVSGLTMQVDGGMFRAL